MTVLINRGREGEVGLALQGSYLAAMDCVYKDNKPFPIVLCFCTTKDMLDRTISALPATFGSFEFFYDFFNGGTQRR